MAQECALRLCVNEHKSSFANGSISEKIRPYPAEKVTDSWAPVPGWRRDGTGNMGPLTDDPNQGSLRQTIEYARYDLQLQGPKQELFNISQRALNTLGGSLDGTFGRATNGLTYGAMQWCSYNGSQCSGDGVTSVYGLDFDKVFQGLALSMTNTMRSIATNSDMIEGFVKIAVYKIVWPWITLPCVLVMMSAAFLSWTIWTTRKKDVPLWKSSSLPPLVHGSRWIEDMVEERDLGSLERKARSTLCHMHWPERDSKLCHYSVKPHALIFILQARSQDLWSNQICDQSSIRMILLVCC